MAIGNVAEREEGPVSPGLFQGDYLNHEGDVCKIRITVADDHRMDAHLVEFDRQGEGKRVVVTDPVHRSDPMGNLEGEVFVVHHR
jgi:hypothetical protein